MNYKLELEKAKEEILKEKAKKVLIQLPDGLKTKATEISDFLKNETNSEVYIWLGSCFGACDIPNVKDFDLLIQWGHTEWKY